MLKNDIENLRTLDIVGVCALLGLVQDEADKKQFIGHGCRISVNGLKWFDHNNNKGGGGAIDLTMHVQHSTFTNAVSFLGNFSGEVVTLSQIAASVKTSHTKKTTIPAVNLDNLPTVTDYLTTKRGLNKDLVKWCIDKGIIYADSRANCVFKYGSNGAELRGTGTRQWRGVYGTIEHGFILPANKAQGVAVCESAIDALSYKQLNKDMIVVSLAGNGNHTVIAQAVSVAIKKAIPVYIATDNDKGGDIAEKLILDYGFSIDFKDFFQSRPYEGFKDWNEYLIKTNWYQT